MPSATMTAFRSGIAVETAKERGIIIGGVSVRLTLREQVAERQLFVLTMSARVFPSASTISAISISLREAIGPLFPKNGGADVVSL